MNMLWNLSFLVLLLYSLVLLILPIHIHPVSYTHLYVYKRQPLALTMKVRDEDKTLPGAVICLSPWTDLTGKGKSHITQADNEILIDSSVLYESGLTYANGQSLKHPYISPVFGDFSCFPPVLIQVGSHEVLLSDSINAVSYTHLDVYKRQLQIEVCS